MRSAPAPAEHPPRSAEAALTTDRFAAFSFVDRISLRAELSLSTLFIAEPEPAGKGRS